MRHLILIGVLLSACAVAPAEQDQTESMTPLEADFTQFLDWFPGRYDSHAQVLSDKRTNTDPALRNYRRHSIFRRVELPTFGETVFLAHQYRDGDPAKVYRQRLYTFSLDPDRAVFWLRVHVPKETEHLDGAYRDPSRLAGLNPDDFTVWGGCDLFWTREDDRFVGQLEPGACRFTSEAFGQEIVLEEVLTLYEDRITFADRGLSLDGDWLFGMRGDTPNISMKARPFLCRLNAQHGWLHDQGGQTDLFGPPLTLKRLGNNDGDSGLSLSATLPDGRIETTISKTDTETVALTLGAEQIICHHAPNTLYTEAGAP